MNSSLKLRELFSNSLANFIRHGLNIILSLLNSVLVARGLGVEGRGIYAIVILLPTLILTFTSFGVASSTVYHVAKKKYSVTLSFYGNMIISLIVSVFSMIAGLFIIIFVQDITMFDGISLPLLLVGLAIIPSSIFVQNISMIFQGLQDFYAYNRTYLVMPLSYLCFNFIFIWVLKWGVIGSVLALIVGNTITLCVAIYYLRKYIKIFFPPQELPTYDYYKNIISYGLRAHIASVMAFLNYRFDVFILAALTDTVSVGIYTIAVTVAERLWILSSSISQVLFPRIVELENFDDDRNRLTLMVARYVLWASLVSGIIALFFADWGFAFLYGEDFRESANVFKWLLPGIISMGMAKVLGNDIGARGYPQVNSIHSVIAVVVNIICNFWLIPIYGYLGAALATSISYIVWMLIKVTYYVYKFKASWYDIFLPNQEDIRLFKKIIPHLFKR